MTPSTEGHCREMEALKKTVLLSHLVALVLLWADCTRAGYPDGGLGNETRGEPSLSAEEPLLEPRNTLTAGGMTPLGSGVLTAGGERGSVRVVINELLASNIEYFADPQGEFDDWIELYNPGDAPLDTGGMYLTDDMSSPRKWQIPLGRPAETTIPAHGYLFVWTDGDIADAGLHAAFSLDAGGEELALIDVDGATVLDSIRFGEQRAGVSYGRFPDGSETWSLLGLPTPGGQNARLYEGFVEKPRMSPGHGFYHGAVLVTITCDTPDAMIFYTTDGSDPYLTDAGHPSPQASVYDQPVQVSRTTCLRVVATRAGWRLSPTETQTYIFVNQVIQQCPNGQSPGGRWPSGRINGQVIDYAMDPDVVNDPRYKDLMNDALYAIPSISLVTDPANLFDPSRGIYVNAGNEGPNWERPVSVELIRPDADGRKGFQIDAGIRIRGGFSRGGDNPKHSFRLFFRSKYGPPSLKYPLFDSEGADEFENVDLRTSQNYAWSLESFNPGQKNTFVREEFCRDLQRETGQPYTRTRYYHLYLNGLYWGLYETQERSEASYAATYFGGEPDDYDVIMTEEHRAASTDGTIDEWNLLWGLCQQGFESDAQYSAVQGKRPDGTDDPDLPVRVDVVNLIDYMLGIFYTGNDDAPVTLGSGNRANNFFAIRNRRLEARQGWQFFAYDNEHSLGAYRDVNDDRTGPVTAGQSREHFNPQWLHQKLMVHPEYRLLFADRAQKHLFNGGAMTPEKAIALCLSRANEIDLAIIGESARWGDQRPSRANNPYTKADWWAEVNGYLIGAFFPARTQIVLNQLRNRGLYPQVAAPVFRINGSYQHGGHIAATDALSMTGGTIWYTLDGSDPRIPGTTGAPVDETKMVADGAPKRVLVPTGPVSDAWRGGQAFDDSGWTAGTGGVGFERSTGYEVFFQIDVESQMYNHNATCYIRIPFNLAASDLAGLARLALKVRYDDGFVAYLNGTEVTRKNFTGTPTWNSAAGALNDDAAAVNWEDFDITAQAPSLQAGANILAVQAMNNTVTSSDFLLGVELISSKAPAGGVPSGVSPTAAKYTQPLVLKQSARVKARALAGTTWSALNEAVYAVGPVAECLRISEIMYHPQDTGAPDDPNTEYVELTNIGGAAVNLNLVRFSAGVDFTFASVELGPAEYLLVVKDADAFEARYGPGLPVAGAYSGSLSNAGERIELQDAVGTTIQSFVYEDNWYKLTDGDGYSLTAADPHGTDPNDWSNLGAWRPSTSPGGSPGRDDATTAQH